MEEKKQENTNEIPIKSCEELLVEFNKILKPEPEIPKENPKENPILTNSQLENNEQPKNDLLSYLISPSENIEEEPVTPPVVLPEEVNTCQGEGPSLDRDHELDQKINFVNQVIFPSPRIILHSK